MISEALESAVPLAKRRDLHARVAAVAAERPELGGPAYRSAHHEAAGESGRRTRQALVAAEQAARGLKPPDRSRPLPPGSPVRAGATARRSDG